MKETIEEQYDNEVYNDKENYRAESKDNCYIRSSQTSE